MKTVRRFALRRAAKKGGTLTLAYLDNSATTRVCEEAAQEILYTLTEGYGNPSSLHAKGFEAERLLRQARERVAGRIGCAPEEVLFTSGGTEANNQDCDDGDRASKCGKTDAGAGAAGV